MKKNLIFFLLISFSSLIFAACNGKKSGAEKLCGQWENEKGGCVQIWDNTIEVWSDSEYDDTTFYSISGIFSCDDKNLYIIRMNHFSDSDPDEDFPKNLTLSYKISGSSELTLFAENYSITVNKVESFKAKKSGQAILNGTWKKLPDKTAEYPIDLVLYVQGSSILATVSGDSFVCELLGGLELSKGKLKVSKTDSTESVFGAVDIVLPDSAEGEIFYDIYSYAEYYKLPENVFLAANEDTPYEGEINYKLKEGKLYLFDEDKIIVLEKQ